jgi:hypothetical protein
MIVIQDGLIKRPPTSILRRSLMPTRAQDVPVALAPEGGFAYDIRKFPSGGFRVLRRISR